MKKESCGFTLIEIMVVIVIVAILMGAVIISLPQGDALVIKKNKERFLALLSFAQDEAILRSQDLALEIEQNGYRYYRRENKQWAPYTEGPFAHQTLEGEIPSALQVEKNVVKLKKHHKVKPQIFISTSGEVTPFIYSLGDDANKVDIHVNGVGNVLLKGKENKPKA